MNLFAQNLKALRLSKELSQAEMAAQLDLPRTTLSSYEQSVSQPDIDRLISIAVILGVSVGDMLTKDLSKDVEVSEKQRIKKAAKNVVVNVEEPVEVNGKTYPENGILSVLKENDTNRLPKVVTVDISGQDRAVMVPVKARAGYLNGYADPEYISQLPSYDLPSFRGALYRLFEVEGSSMLPTLYDKNIVIGQYLEDLSQIREDRVHVIITRDAGVVVKRCLNRVEKEGLIVLKSDNWRDRDLYPTMVAYPEDIIEVWYVAGFISRQLPVPNENYKRLNEVEAQLAVIGEKLKKAGL